MASHDAVPKAKMDGYGKPYPVELESSWLERSGCVLNRVGQPVSHAWNGNLEHTLLLALCE